VSVLSLYLSTRQWLNQRAAISTPCDKQLLQEGEIPLGSEISFFLFSKFFEIGQIPSVHAAGFVTRCHFLFCDLDHIIPHQ
jgi:hypothetical protein